MRNPFRDPYVTWHAGAESPHAEDASPSDPLRVVWAARTDRHGNRISNPVKVFDPDYVSTWERTEYDTTDGLRASVVVETGPYPTPKALDYAVYASVGSLLLMIGALFGASV